MSGKTFLKTLRRMSWIIGVPAVLVLAMLIPYPYEAGGTFRLLPLERIELHALVPGEIRSVLYKENDHVVRGSVQATIDDNEHRKNMNATQAELDRAKAELKLLESGPKPEEVRKAQEQVGTATTQAEFSRKEETRLKALFKEGVVSQEEYEQAQGKAEVDRQNLEVARANLDLVKTGAREEALEAQRAVVRDLTEKTRYYAANLQNTRLLAPITGRVVTPYMESKVGQYLKQGDLFATYENSGEILAEIHIPEADAPEVRVGGRVKIRPEAYPTRLFYGTVSLVAPNAVDTPNGKVVRVVTRIPNGRGELKPEMTGAAKIEGGRRPLVVAYTRAIVRFFMVEVWSWFP